MPYAERIISSLKAKYPHVPVIFHANGGTGELSKWVIDNGKARKTAAGPSGIYCGKGWIGNYFFHLSLLEDHVSLEEDARTAEADFSVTPSTVMESRERLGCM